jgi:hypothetical protein
MWGDDGNDIMFGGHGLSDLDLNQDGVCEDYSQKADITGPYDCENGADESRPVQDDEADQMYGGNGNDIMFGQEGGDYISGDAGDDVIFGGVGNDTILGGADDDILFGEEGDDSISGGNGDDFLGGGVGDDTLNGGDGDDYILGGEGDDDLTGGDGKDVFFSDLTLSYDDDDGYSFSSTDGTDIIRDFDFNEDQDVLGFRITVDDSAEGTLGTTVAQIRTRLFELLDEAATVSEGDAGVGASAADTTIEIGGHTLILQDVNWQDVTAFDIPATTFSSLGQDSNLNGGVGINSTANGLDSGGYTAIGSWDVENDLYCPDLPEVDDWYCNVAAAT